MSACVSLCSWHVISSAQYATALFGRNLSGYYKSLTLSGKYCLSLPVGQLIAQNLADSASWLLPRYRRYIISVQSLKVINFVIEKDTTAILFSSETWFHPTVHTEQALVCRTPTPLIHKEIPYMKLIKVCRCVTSASRIGYWADVFETANKFTTIGCSYWNI